MLMKKKSTILVGIMFVMLATSFAIIPTVSAVDYKARIYVLQANGTPVSNAMVQVWTTTGTPYGHKYTNGDGKVVFTLPDGDSYKATYQKGAPNEPGTEYFTISGSDIDVVVSYNQKTFLVTESDGSNSPVDNAQIQIKNTKGKLLTHGYTAPNGKVTFWLPDGTYVAELRKWSTPAQVKQTFTMGAFHVTKFTITVEDSGENPVVNKRVDIYRGSKMINFKYTNVNL